ncbi:MAG: bifunctional 3'-5' exonuclease/DNA polymerase, partial [Cellulomonas sp. 14-74-6]
MGGAREGGRVLILVTRRPDGTTARVRRVDRQVPHGVVGPESVPRWVWSDTSALYPGLLADGVRVERCLDLRLTHRVLRLAPAVATSPLATAAAGPFDAPAPAEPGSSTETLFDEVRAERPLDEETCLAELAAQDEAVERAAPPARLRLLLAAESAGALAAAEMRHAGVPWDPAVHDEVLRSLLGPRPRVRERPRRLEQLAERLRSELDAPALNPDSQPDLLRALRRVGLPV